MSRPVKDESTLVQLDEVAGPLCARLGADYYEDGRGGDLFTLAGPDVLECQGCQAGLAVAVGNSGAEPDSDVGVASSWVMRCRTCSRPATRPGRAA
jgi:hypothetical protein